MLNLIRRHPAEKWGMMNLRDEVDRVFRDFYNTDFDGGSRWMPSVDIAEDKDKFMLSAELPGVKKEDVKISLNNNTLTIEGEKKTDFEKKEDNSYRSERFYGKFSRSFTLSSEIEADKIEADFKDGILNVSLPKSEKVKPRQITIN